ncbi:MAG: hypothetical protein ABIP55_03970 [Tepidisphaeraceae bacterium]
MTTTWEAFRLTSKSPNEVLHVLGPHGVDDLIRMAMDAVWREYPEETRSYENVKKRMLEVYQRNMRHWNSIAKPTPAAFFDKLLPYTADGHVRQALVLAWMMMPRAGGRDFKDVKKIVAAIFQRNLTAWDEDHRTFTAASARKKPPAEKPARKKKPVAKKAVAKRRTKKAK